MAAPRYLNVNPSAIGWSQVAAITASAGVADAEKIIATDTNGTLASSLFGSNTVALTALSQPAANTFLANATAATAAVTAVAVTAGHHVGRTSGGNLASLTPAQSRLMLRQTASALTSGATVNWDLANGLFFTLTAGTNFTLAFPSSPAQGETAFIYVTQDATGSRTITFNSAFKFAGGTALTLSTAANAIDRLEFFFHTAAAATVTITKDIK